MGTVLAVAIAFLLNAGVARTETSEGLLDERAA
jgi:hypothetical protein